MQLNQINASWLDIYQSFIKSETAGDEVEMTEEELYWRFYGSYNKNPLHFANQAWKSHLHNPSDNRDIVKIDGFTFNSERMKNSQQALINIGMRNERKVSHTCQLIEGVELFSVFDVDAPYQVIAHELDDKLQMEKYFDSWRWRAELAMCKKRTFTYQLFECYEVKPFESLVTISNYHSVDMHSYVGMIDDVKDIVSEIDALINVWKSNGNTCQPFQ